MRIASIARRGISVQGRPGVKLLQHKSAPMSAAGAGAEGGKAEGVVEGLVRFIPADVIAVYVPVVALTAAKDEALGAGFYVWLIGMLVTAFFFLVTYLGEMRRADPSTEPSFPWFYFVAAVSSFSIWGACVPGVFPSNAYTEYLGVGALLLGFALSMLERNLYPPAPAAGGGPPLI